MHVMALASSSVVRCIPLARDAIILPGPVAEAREQRCVSHTDSSHCHLASRAAPNAYTLPSARQHPSYGDCLEVKTEYYHNCSMLGCVTQCSQSATHSCEQFLQVQQTGFVTLGPLRHA